MPTSDATRRLASINRHFRQAMSKPRVIVARDLGSDAMKILREAEDIELVAWEDDKICDREWFSEKVAGASGIALTMLDKVDQELLTNAGPSLKVVSTMSVGYEHLPLEELGKRNIRVGYTPDVLTDAVADVSIMLALMVGRNVRQVTTIVENGNWPRNPWSPFAFVGPQLSADAVPDITRNSTVLAPTSTIGVTAGFFGFGRISHAVVKRILAFGVRNIIYTGNPTSPSSAAQDAQLAKDLSSHLSHDAARAIRITRVSIDNLARMSDIVFVLAPGGPSTYHVISTDFLSLMKPTSILINAARGTLVDSSALATALREKRIWGAGLDVVEGEPDIAANHELLKEERCVILPHVGSATHETRKAMAVLCARNVLAGVRGEPMPLELDFHGRA